MSEFRPIEEPLEEIRERVGPVPRPYQRITAISALWNEAARAPALLGLLKQNFAAIHVIVQESTDDTLAICRELLDRPDDWVGEHPHHGFGDASFPDLARSVKTPWAFLVSGDEMPDEKLLGSLGIAFAEAERQGANCVWVKLDQVLEGQFIPEQAYHSRGFRPELGWPGTLHSRPPSDNGIGWPYGQILHTRSLDEMIVDYLSYYEVGRGNKGWEHHNVLMMHDACEVTARHKGWGYVRSFEWWPRVRDLAFEGKEPDG